MTWDVRQGDCRELLRAMPAESVHCVVTSPPYWGLRDYGLPPLVWGGAEGCEHSWGEEQATRSMTHQDRLGNATDPRTGRPAGGQVHGQPGGFSVAQGQFCSKCGAWLGSLGLESTPELYIAHMVEVFREVKRVMRKDATCWVNMGDGYSSVGQNAGGEVGSYRDKNGKKRTYIRSPYTIRRNTAKSGWADAPISKRDIGMIEHETVLGNLPLKPKDLCGMPWRLAFALQADGWWLRSAITWCKGSPMPESVTDRPTNATEMIFLLSKSKSYFYDVDAGRVFARRLNPSNTVNKERLAVERAPALGLATKSGNVASADQLLPYFKLACLLATQPIALEERHDLLSETFDVLKAPVADRIPLLANLVRSQYAAEIVVHILEQWKVICPKLDLKTEAELWIDFAAALSFPIVGVNASLTVEQTREVVAKVIANAQLVRNAVALDALLKGPIDVDMVGQAIPLFDCAEPLASHGGDSLVAESAVEKLALALGNGWGDSRVDSVGHDTLRMFSPDEYTPATTTASNGRNVWNWWVINPRGYKEAHFATFSPEIPEYCIKLGSPTKCCAVCGKGWERVTETKFVIAQDRSAAKAVRSHEGEKPMDASNTWGGSTRGSNAVATLGFRPGCECNLPPWVLTPRQALLETNEAYAERLAPVREEQRRLMVIYAAHEHETVPAVVLDCFVGSGTSVMVALRHARNAIGLELSKEYAEMARRRIVDDAPLWNSR